GTGASEATLIYGKTQTGNHEIQTDCRHSGNSTIFLSCIPGCRGDNYGQRDRLLQQGGNAALIWRLRAGDYLFRPGPCVEHELDQSNRWPPLYVPGQVLCPDPDGDVQ